MGVTPDTTRCLNCDAPLSGPYCAACGQRAQDPDPTFVALVAEFANELFDWDGKIPATLRALLTDPGRLTLDVLAGRRARWLAPLRAYLICSVAYFLSGPVVEAVSGRRAKDVAQITFTSPGGGQQPITEFTPEVREAIRASPVFSRIGEERLRAMAAHLDEVNGIVVAAMPKAMFVLMPLFALLTWAAWRDTLPRYPAHLYFALHVHAAFFAALVVPTLTSVVGSLAVDTFVGLATLVYTTWYAAVATKRVLGGTPGQLVARSLVVGVVYGTAFVFVTIVITIGAIASFAA